MYVDNMWLDAACLAPCMLLYGDGSLADAHYSVGFRTVVFRVDTNNSNTIEEQSKYMGFC